MTAAAALDPALESLLAFWAEAGVDVAVEDEPTDKLRRLEPPPRPAQMVQIAPPATTATGARSEDFTSALLQAQASAQAAEDLPSLLAAAGIFTPIGFIPAGARRGLLARGSARADVVVIGGAPGAEEEGAGAFADGAGRFLDRMLAAAGFSGRTLLTHTSLWRTPGGRDPMPEEAALARPFVLRAIALARPKALLVLGEVAARALLGRQDGVLKLRREALVWTEHEGSAEAPAVVVSFSPEFLLATPSAKKRAWADLLTLAERVDP